MGIGLRRHFPLDVCGLLQLFVWRLALKFGDIEKVAELKRDLDIAEGRLTSLAIYVSDRQLVSVRFSKEQYAQSYTSFFVSDPILRELVITMTEKQLILSRDYLLKQLMDLGVE